MAIARFHGLCIDVADARASGDYWATMLGWRLEMHDDGDAHLRDGDGRVQVWLNVVPEPKSVKNRIHLDVFAESVQRALDAGARFAYEVPRWSTLFDPDGQEHCVFVREPPLDRRAYELGWDCAVGAEHETAVWWAEVLGGRVGDDFERGFSWVEAIPGCVWESIDFAGVPEPKTAKNRVHLDVETDDLGALVSHGATVLRAKGEGGIGWTVLADPAGNEFCAFTQ